MLLECGWVNSNDESVMVTGVVEDEERKKGRKKVDGAFDQI